MIYKKYFSEYEELRDTPIESKIQTKIKRSLRRKHKERKKLYSKKVYGNTKYADHMKACSCFMCGNPRKYKIKSIQERKITDVLDEMVQE